MVVSRLSCVSLTFESEEEEEADETDDEVAAVPFRLETTLGTVEVADTRRQHRTKR